VDETGPDTTRREGVRADHYATQHGLSVGAVRKRIERGQLEAYKGEGGRWYVLGPMPVDTTRQDTRQDGGQDATRLVAPTAQAQIALLNELVAPYVATIAAQAEELGQVKAERDAALAMLQSQATARVPWWRRLFDRGKP